MRRIINSTYITLDGAVEDPRLWPSQGDAGAAASFDIQNELLQSCDALIMGRRTYNAFASVWPTRSGDARSDRINTMKKYAVSSTLQNPAWSNTEVIGRDVVVEVTKLKQQSGKDIVQSGLGQVPFTLMEHGLMGDPLVGASPPLGKQRAPDSPLSRLQADSTGPC